MAYVAKGNHKKVIKTGVESFREKAVVLQQELKECEEKRKQFLEDSKKAKVRYHKYKQEAPGIRLRIQEIDERMEKIERDLKINKEKIYQTNRRKQENVYMIEKLEMPMPDMGELAKEIQTASQYAALMRQKKAGVHSKIEILEDKIQRAERRREKAEDMSYTILQKLATHRHLLGNPEVTCNYKPMKQEAYISKMNNAREKIRIAGIRRRRAEDVAGNLEKRIEVMDKALDNYERRISDFNKSKREIMGSKF